MSRSPMAPGTALNEVAVAVWASAAGFKSRLPPVTPMAAPTASANTIVPVLVIAVLPSPAGAGHVGSSVASLAPTYEPGRNSADPVAYVPFLPSLDILRVFIH